jgi:hypothetical protein
MDNGTVKTVGIVLIVIGAFVALGGAFIPDIEVGGSASGGGSTAEGGVSVGFGGLLWVGLAVMAVGVILTVAGMFAPDDRREREPRPPADE